MKISNKEAIAYIIEKRMLINGSPAKIKQVITTEDRIVMNGQVLQSSERFIYLAYYKPRGIETTLNKEITSNLADSLNFPTKVFPLGRLDKESEGLLLLTNNGRIFNKITHDKQYKEKEYIVTVNKPLTKEAMNRMASGITILGRITRPSQISQIDACTFRITLTQGINRQIRRMCYQLKYEVLKLRRTRIVNIHLGQLGTGEWRYLSEEEVVGLLQLPDKTS